MACIHTYIFIIILFTIFFQINETESTDEYDPSSGVSADDSDDDVQ